MRSSNRLWAYFWKSKPYIRLTFGVFHWFPGSAWTDTRNVESPGTTPPFGWNRCRYGASRSRCDDSIVSSKGMGYCNSSKLFLFMFATFRTSLPCCARSRSMSAAPSAGAAAATQVDQTAEHAQDVLTQITAHAAPERFSAEHLALRPTDRRLVGRICGQFRRE